MRVDFEESWIEGAPRLRLLRRRGGGRRLLLLHGVLRCGADFFPMLAYLDETLDVMMLDQRGHGASERADGYRVTDYLSDAMRVVEAVGVEGLVVFGHSLGAMVAAAVAEATAVAGVVLEDPPFATMGSRIAGSVWQQVFAGFRDALRSGGGIDGLFGRLRGILVTGGDGKVRMLSQLRDDASLRWSAECLAQLDPQVLDPLVEGKWLEGFAWEGVLTRARCSVLLLQGDVGSGGALTSGDAEIAGVGGERVTSVFFEGQGHQLHATNPERVALLVNGFMASR